MRVLWITNGPIIAKHREMLGSGPSQSGGWLVAAYDAMRDNNDVTLGVATTYIGETIQEAAEGSQTFYLIPCKKMAHFYNPDLEENISQWKEIISRFKPDIIQVWGSEFPYGTCALKAAPEIPSVIYIQGLMAQIANHGDGQISFSDKVCSTTVSDIVKKTTYWHQQNEYEMRKHNEQKMLELADGVIVENNWSAENYRIMKSDCKVFKSLLPINIIFAEYDWIYENCDKHTLFTTAGPSAIKGHHILFKALAIVKHYYPDVKLRIPGLSYYFENSLSRRLKRQSYHKYLLSIIKKCDLSENITFVGSLSQREMAENMAKCNVFVMPSAIENHSSTLIEAMMVGVPTVASNVGGIEEYYHNEENGLIYRFDEPEVLAAKIMELFANSELAINIGKNAKEQTRNIRMNIDIKDDFESCYNSLLQKTK